MGVRINFSRPHLFHSSTVSTILSKVTTPSPQFSFETLSETSFEHIVDDLQVVKYFVIIVFCLLLLFGFVCIFKAVVSCLRFLKRRRVPVTGNNETVISMSQLSAANESAASGSNLNFQNVAPPKPIPLPPTAQRLKKTGEKYY